MPLKVKKPAEMNYIGRQIERDIRNFLTVRLVTGLKEFHRSLLDTPVYTGRTLVNFRWSLDAPLDARRAAVRVPLLPGKTSSLGLGNEPRRAANQAIIDTEFNMMINTMLKDRNPFRKFYLRNNMPNFSDIEYGSYSEKSRTPPGGMTRRGEAKLRAIVRGIKKVG